MCLSVLIIESSGPITLRISGLPPLKVLMILNWPTLAKIIHTVSITRPIGNMTSITIFLVRDRVSSLRNENTQMKRFHLFQETP